MDPEVTVRQIDTDELERYSHVPIRFLVESVLRIDAVDGGLGGLTLTEEKVDRPYVKDYDVWEAKGVLHWAKLFDVSNWLFLLAESAGRPVGGAAVAFRSPEVDMLEGRDDLAVLWDLRVDPDWRGRGIGKALLARAVAWARQANCAQLKIETQNINVPACRFYAARGCELAMIDRYGYASEASIAHEAMLYWYLDL